MKEWIAISAVAGLGVAYIVTIDNPETYEGQVVIKREILPDGRHKLILKDPATGDFTDRVVAGA